MRNLSPSPFLLGYLGFLLLLSNQVLGVQMGAQVANADTTEALSLHMNHIQFMKQANSRLSASETDDDDDDDDYSCSKTKECSVGCCGPLNDDGVGVCGMGPDYCGDDCYSNCDSKAECDPGWGLEWSNASTCPLNVCCSSYGFCGTTELFCGEELASSPECAVSANSSSARTIGYYEGWNWQRSCGTIIPDEIPLGYYSHINFAFALINPTTYRIDNMDDTTGTLYSAVTGLKAHQPNLEVWIAVGGWAMNDPGSYRPVFSDLAADEDKQDIFFEALITFMATNNFDGVDLDWEYPMADDRGGSDADYSNYVNFVSRLRQRLSEEGRVYGLSLTLPASYWYLRGFDIVGLEPYLDWFNVMTYDIHGVWDGTIPSLGAHARAHTNLTEIDEALKLLWRNNINPERINMGLGFYGRSFTMKDPSCMTAGCEFSSAGGNGSCTGTAGTLSATEIRQIIAKDDVTMTLDPVAAVEIVTWGGDQWVSWDDTKTLNMKVEFANERCLGGVMVWAIDLDDGTLIRSLADTGRGTTDVINELPALLPCFGSSNGSLDWAYWNDTSS